MDTMREKKELNKIWKSKQKAWKILFHLNLSKRNQIL